MDQTILRSPDRARAWIDDGSVELTRSANGIWQGPGLEVETIAQGARLPIVLSAPGVAVKRIQLRWDFAITNSVLVLGDHWERGYGDLEWRGLVPERVMPWYFLIHENDGTNAYGVETGANALCFWQCDPAGISLWLDVRCGGDGVHLGARRLTAAVVRERQGEPGESPFAAATEFCRSLCDIPILPAQPVYGGNNWYYAYGKSSHTQILADTENIVSLSPTGDNRPFMVIDDGWQLNGPIVGGGPWCYSNPDFPDMARLASEMKERGARPGLWMRPLLTTERLPTHWFLRRGRFASEDGAVLDSTVPEALAYIARETKILAGWGYELLKHDFSTYDLLGRWGFAMGAEVTAGGWHFADRSKTTAEAIGDLYRTIRAAAGSALVLGCNVIGHLAAGLVEIQRTGDDTSGREWERTRKMGINTLAFRMPQHETFFAADADCVGLTNDIPWNLNAQWLDLLARSGTPLFVSADPNALGPAQRAAVREAFALASQPQPPAEPLDWLHTSCPASWQFGSEKRSYQWDSPFGTDPFAG